MVEEGVVVMVVNWEAEDLVVVFLGLEVEVGSLVHQIPLCVFCS